MDLFEELADVALWQKKTAHVVTYRDSQHKRGQRAGSPVPVIELHDKVCMVRNRRNSTSTLFFFLFML